MKVVVTVHDLERSLLVNVSAGLTSKRRHGEEIDGRFLDLRRKLPVLANKR